MGFHYGVESVFFPVLILVAGVLYFFPSCFFLILHIFGFGWRVEFADLMGLFRLGIEAVDQLGYNSKWKGSALLHSPQRVW